MRMQVLAIGPTETGTNQYTKAEWFRRVFQVFTADQVAGNVRVYGTKEELDTYKQGGTYEATIQSQPANRGEIELRITKLTPVKAPA